MMKKLIVLFIVSVSVHLHAEWKKPGQENSLNTQAAIIVNPSLRFAIENQYIYKSTDQGKSWQKDSLDIDLSKYYLQKQSIHFSDENNVLVFLILQERNDNTSTGLLFKTSDQGNTWSNIPLDAKVDYYTSFYMKDKQWVILSQDRVIFTEDEGKAWQDLHDQMPDPVMLDIRIVADKWFLLTNNLDGNMPALHLSTNKGQSWQTIGKIDFRQDSLSMPIIFPGDLQVMENDLYLVLNIYYPSCGFFYDHSFLYHFERKVHNWEMTVFPEMRLQPISRILFISDDVAFALSGNTIYKSTDGGKTWFSTYILPYEDGNFTELTLTGGILTASTSKGIIVTNGNTGNDPNLSFREIASRIEVVVYPNPANGLVNIRLPEIISQCSVLLMNEAGQAVLESSYRECLLIELDTAGLAPGIYFYSIIANGKTTSGKINIL